MRAIALLTTVFALTFSGCGGTASAPKSGDVLTPEALADLKDLLTRFQVLQKRAPKAVADFAALEPAYPAGAACVTSGQCIYIWGAALDPTSKAILAHGKGASTDGGPVLLQDGTIKTLTAAEFAAAPKAAKK